MPTPEMNVLFFYPTNSQPTFSVYVFPKGALTRNSCWF